MTTKLKVGILFGGKSGEHEVSLLSALNIVNALDRKKYDIVLIGIDKNGLWYVQENLLPHDAAHTKLTALTTETHLNNWVTLTPGVNHPRLSGVMSKENFAALDVVFPVLHGTYGEDGTIQGLLRLANVPFVGSDVLSSALCMDKALFKRVAKDAGLPVAAYVTVHKRELSKLNIDTIIKAVGLPCFVKPANLGSSVGISKVKTADGLRPAIEQALVFDHKVVIETAIVGREIECGVLGNDEPIASLPGEIIPHAEFYSYEAKYLDPNGAEVLPVAKLTETQVKQVQALSIQAFQVFECEGMARVDFFLQADGQLILNEINTIPGFTRISQYPKMWEATGISYSELLDRLIQLALTRFTERQKIQTDFSTLAKS